MRMLISFAMLILINVHIIYSLESPEMTLTLSIDKNKISMNENVTVVMKLSNLTTENKTLDDLAFYYNQPFCLVFYYQDIITKELIEIKKSIYAIVEKRFPLNPISIRSMGTLTSEIRTSLKYGRYKDIFTNEIINGCVLDFRSDCVFIPIPVGINKIYVSSFVKINQEIIESNRIEIDWECEAVEAHGNQFSRNRQNI